MSVYKSESEIKQEEAGCLILFIAMILLVLSPFIGMAFESCDPAKHNMTRSNIPPDNTTKHYGGIKGE